MTSKVALPEVDRVEVLTVVDNSIDLLMAPSEGARRVLLWA